MDTSTASDDFDVVTTGAAPAAEPPVTPALIEATPEADNAVLADPGDEDPPAPPVPDTKPRSLQARIDRAVAGQREAERRAESAERALVARSQPVEPAPVTVAPSYTRAKPTEAEIGEKYQDYPAFIEDLSDWKDEQREVQRSEHRHREQVAQSHEAHAAQFSERIAIAEQADPEYWSKIDPAVANLKPSSGLGPGEKATALNAIADIIFDSEYSTELMAHLRASDLQRLSTLPPAQLFRAMGRLEASVMRPAAASAGPATRMPAISAAPPPIKPVGSSAAAPTDVELDPDDLSEEGIKAHFRTHNARDKRGRFA